MSLWGNSDIYKRIPEHPLCEIQEGCQKDVMSLMRNLVDGCRLTEPLIDSPIIEMDKDFKSNSVDIA